LIIGFIIPVTFFNIDVLANVAATETPAVAPAATKISGAGIGNAIPNTCTVTTPSNVSVLGTSGTIGSIGSRSNGHPSSVSILGLCTW
jgi:hypothetical protein